MGEPVEVGGRNSYPDFRMVRETEGYELKGLAYPGRDATFDSNSQIPTGLHNGRTIYYVFGRYPKQPDGNEYPVLDLVICHGDFLNVTRDYEHQNKSVGHLAATATCARGRPPTSHKAAYLMPPNTVRRLSMLPSGPGKLPEIAAGRAAKARM
ncbi:MAG: hypothetical protein M3473_01780 [Chloroflexota bacterium]|nr:hypothetical protein [Chloroflexota bacterium]